MIDHSKTVATKPPIEQAVEALEKANDCLQGFNPLSPDSHRFGRRVRVLEEIANALTALRAPVAGDCATCNGRREVGWFDKGDNAYRTEACPDCAVPPPAAGGVRPAEEWAKEVPFTAWDLVALLRRVQQDALASRQPEARPSKDVSDLDGNGRELLPCGGKRP